ncbi:uncharacterized protein RCO7_11403 [Rhynchosporium graminicola]|uniref:Uncharacterized protein n=1 Tax=Rhynchosporium graminicola TaxID=2792576 RepID=A0A1E1LN41_9HELO|nr:uncharacterized protein RCO7_11403 [Rhynchosporium commune]
MHTTLPLLAALGLMTPSLSAPTSHTIEIIITTDSSVPVHHTLYAGPHVSKQAEHADMEEQCLEMHFPHPIDCEEEISKGWYFAHGQCCEGTDEQEFMLPKHNTGTIIKVDMPTGFSAESKTGANMPTGFNVNSKIEDEMPTGFNINLKIENDMPTGFGMNGKKGSQSVVPVHMPNGFNVLSDEKEPASQGDMPTGFGSKLSEHTQTIVEGEMPTGFGIKSQTVHEEMPTGFESKGRVVSDVNVIHTEML